MTTGGTALEWRVWAVLAAAGCGGPEVEATWLEGFGYAWAGFNHRVSYIGVSLDDDTARIGIVGGTSTTGSAPDLPAGCDPDTCTEYPFFDTARATVRWGRIASRKVAAGTGTVELRVGSGGASATVEVPLSSKGHGDVVAVIDGLAIDTDVPLAGGDACYRPEYGWHPRRIAVSLGEAAIASDGTAVSVPVSAAFEAGASYEEVRECVDAVVSQAVVRVAVDVLVVVGRGESSAVEVSHAMAFAWDGDAGSPPVQPDPDPADRPYDPGVDPASALVGWSAIDFAFHVADDVGRGAYLRTWSFVADAEAGTASGHATNYSPGTQTSGFDYTFAGTVRAMDLRGDVTRGTLEVDLAERVDDAGAPAIETFAL